MPKDDAPVSIEQIAASLDVPFELPQEESRPVGGKQFPSDVYYQVNSLYQDASGKQIEELVPAYVRPDVFEGLKKEAGNRAVPILAMLRQGLHTSFQNGGFDCGSAQAEEEQFKVPLKRTGNDDNHQHIESIRLRAMLGESNFGILLAHAKPAKISNVAALSRGLKVAIDKGAL